MALEALFDSKYLSALCSRALTSVSGGNAPSSSSDNLLQKDGQFQAVVASILNGSSGNLPGSVAKIANPALLHEVKSNRFSSLGPDSDSAVLGPQLHRIANASTSNNVYSHLNLPPLPVFSNNLSSSGPSNIDGSSTEQENSHLGINSSHKRKQQQGGGFNTTAHPEPPRRQNGIKLDLFTSTEMHKKPRLDIKQDNILHQHIIPQLLQGQDSLQSQGQVSQLQMLLQQRKSQSEKPQNILQTTIPQLERVDVENLQQQEQMRQHILQQVAHQVPASYALDSGVCSRRIMQYMYHMRHRPSDNGIAYWRKFVTEYYAPCAKIRWCLSLYDNVGHHALGVSFQDSWQCDVCGTKSGRGLEANMEVLPRLNKVMFESGVIDELLYLDLARECVKLNGLMMLEYGKAVQESVYEQFRVVREGKLRIVFTPDLKILSWEFCALRHEEFYSRNLVAPQVNQLLHAAQEFQSTIGSRGSEELSTHDLQANYNTFLVAGCRLAKSLELQPIDNLGFCKRYVRSLQLAEVVNSMKDLITFSLDTNTGPIESLKKYSREISPTGPLKDELHEKESTRGLPTDERNSMASSPVLDNNENNCSNITSCRHHTGSGEELVPTGYYERLLRHNSLNSDTIKPIQEPSSSSYNRCKQAASFRAFQDPRISNQELIQNLSVDSLSSSLSADSNQKTQETVIRKLLLEMINNSRSTNRNRVIEEVNNQISSGRVAGLAATTRGVDVYANELDFRNRTVAASGNAVNSIVRENGSFTAACSTIPSGNFSVDSFTKNEEYLPEVIRNMACGYYDNRIPDGDRGDMNYNRKT